MPSTTVKRKRTLNKILPIIYMIDTSKSMIDERIGAVNTAMRNTIDVLKEFAEEDDNSEVRVQVTAVTFDTDIKWITKKLEDLEDFIWTNVEAKGLTKLGLAIKSLEEKLHRTGMGILTDDMGYYPPVIILMSDGLPNDDWKTALANAKQNKIFKSAIKIAIGIGTDAETEAVLAEFTGSNESVITVNDLDALKDLIRILSTLVSSTMSTTGTINKNNIIKEATDQVKGAKTVKPISNVNNDTNNTSSTIDSFIANGKFTFNTTDWE